MVEGEDVIHALVEVLLGLGAGGFDRVARIAQTGDERTGRVSGLSAGMVICAQVKVALRRGK